jgi:uncharacterized protein YbaR (Trm112 family)
MTKYFEFLQCPETRQKLDLFSLSEAESKIAGKLLPLRNTTSDTFSNIPVPIGVTQEVLLRKDHLGAYPVIDGIPVLLMPEILGINGQQRVFDFNDARYSESYAEMDIYNKVAIRESSNIEKSEAYKIIEPLLTAPQAQLKSFPNPRNIWIDAIYDCGGQWDAYNHIGPVYGQRILQLGGKGIHAIKFLLAGAKEAWVLSPMIGEIICSESLGKISGVSDRLHGVTGIAEEMPFMDGFFDAVYSGGCVHHMVTSLALPEISRVLCEGGKFCSVDPWHTPVYGLGKRIFGQRESAHCHPLTKKRIDPLSHVFSDFQVIHHGALLRYPLLVLNKIGFMMSIEASWRINQMDDFLSDLLPGFRNYMGGSVSLLCTK